MSKLERIIHDNSNGLDYILVGEIYLPLIAVPEERLVFMEVFTETI